MSLNFGLHVTVETVGREEDCRHKFGARNGPSDVVVGLAVQGIGDDSKSSGLRTSPARQKHGAVKQHQRPR